MRHTLAAIAVILAASLVIAAPSKTASIPLSWTMPTENIDGSPLTDLAGAKIYYGTSSSNYTHVIDVGLTNACIVTGLQFGVMYYFNGTAYNTAGLESDFCNEVAKVSNKPKRFSTLEVTK